MTRPCNSVKCDVAAILWPGIAVIVTIIVDHPLYVPLSPTHLLFLQSFSFEPALEMKATSQSRDFSLKSNLIHDFRVGIDRFSALFQRCSKIGELAQGLVPLFFCTLCSCPLTLLSLLLPIVNKSKSALCSLLSFLLC